MAYEYKVVRRVEFSETDMAGIVHYSNFYRYMEVAEHSFFRSLGFSVITRQVDPPVGWPRVHASCDFLKPVYFEDEIEVHMLVAEKKPKSLTYQFRFTKVNVNPPIEVAHGKMTVVCVTRNAEGAMSATNIPDAIANKIAVAPAKVLR